MKKIISLAFSILISSSPVLAWGWGDEVNCSYSKETVNPEKSEKVDKSDK